MFLTFKSSYSSLAWLIWYVNSLGFAHLLRGVNNKHSSEHYTKREHYILHTNVSSHAEGEFGTSLEIIGERMTNSTQEYIQKYPMHKKGENLSVTKNWLFKRRIVIKVRKSQKEIFSCFLPLGSKMGRIKTIIALYFTNQGVTITLKNAFFCFNPF